MATKQYTYAEVKEHIDSRSAWIVIHNIVYDVTQWLDKHPGGEEVLLEQAGRDASECFDNIGHSEEAKELRAKYKVGEIVEAERKPVIEKPNIIFQKIEDDSAQSSLPQWTVPVALGVIAAIIYILYF